MDREELIKFANEQLEVFARDSRMVEFLQSVIEECNKQKWTPVEESLPDEDGKYLCVVKTINGKFITDIKGFTKDAYKFDKFDFYKYKKKKKALFYGYHSDYVYYEVDDVIKWMQLPKG